MNRKTHRAFALSLTPLIYIPLPKSLEKYAPKLIHTYNEFSAELAKATQDALGLWIILLAIFLITTFISSTLPDKDFLLKIFYHKDKRHLTYLYHRQFTHSILVFLLILYFIPNYLSTPLEYALFYGFIYGVGSHLIADMSTGTIPILFNGSYYNYFTRIGLVTFLPKIYHEFFMKKLAIISDNNLWIYFIFFIINIIVTFNYYN